MKALIFISLLMAATLAAIRLHPKFTGLTFHQYLSALFSRKRPRTRDFYRSSSWLGLFLHLNPFPYEIGIDFRGVYLIRRHFTGLFKRKFFYPMSMVKLINTTEYLGRFVRVNLLIDNAGVMTEIRVNRLFALKDAQNFYMFWVATYNQINNN